MLVGPAVWYENPYAGLVVGHFSRLLLVTAISFFSIVPHFYLRCGINARADGSYTKAMATKPLHLQQFILNSVALKVKQNCKNLVLTPKKGHSVDQDVSTGRDAVRSYTIASKITIFASVGN